ncbi:hypothetical protein M0R45_030813 [Rubus argutus]|uniref:Uncharacterized protein n=1 Tax=Rubus argutus TaxID=59490 RepID=A0AAW1WER6_RUBAR
MSEVVLIWARVQFLLTRESSGLCELAAERARARGDDVRPGKGADGGFEIDGCSEGEVAEIRKDTTLRAEASRKSSERVKAKMPMVDYASSDDDVSEEENRENKENEPAQVAMDDDPQPPTTRPQAQ